MNARARLRKEIGDRFNLGELKTLAFDLGLDHDNFHPQKDGFIRDLISTVEEKGMVKHFLTLLSEERPWTSWPTESELELTPRENSTKQEKCEICGHGNPKNLSEYPDDITRCKKCVDTIVYGRSIPTIRLLTLPYDVIEKMNAEYDKWYFGLRKED